MVQIAYICVFLHIVVNGILLAIISNWYDWNDVGGRCAVFLLCPIACARLVAAIDISRAKSIRNEDLSMFGKTCVTLSDKLRAIVFDFVWFCAYGRLMWVAYHLAGELGSSRGCRLYWVGCRQYWQGIQGILQLGIAAYGCSIAIVMLSVFILDVKFGNVFVLWLRLQRRRNPR